MFNIKKGHFASLIEALKITFFSNHFTYKKGENLRQVIKDAGVPEKVGVYIISSDEKLDKIYYIGKAGTMKNDGNFKNQNLNKRLSKKQENKQRRFFYNEFMEKENLNQIEITWLAFEKTTKILPAFAETYLLQCYYEEYCRLPCLNKEV